MAKRVSAAEQRDAILLVGLRQHLAAERSPGSLVASLEESLARPGPLPTPEEAMWLEVLKGTVAAVLAGVQKEG